ncbi:MAG: YihY/virulence factor BrkB family protein, partial [Hyphomicrobiaceae bacterium]
MQRTGALLLAIYRLYHDSGVVLAGAVAFSSILSMFPFCILLGSLAGLAGGRELAEQAVALLVDVLPEKVAATIAPQVMTVMGASRFDLLTVGGLLALFFATGAFETMRQALNTAYRAE